LEFSWPRSELPLNPKFVFQYELAAATLGSERQHISILRPPRRGCYVSGWKLLCLQLCGSDASYSGGGPSKLLWLIRPRYLLQIPNRVCRLQIYPVVLRFCPGSTSLCAGCFQGRCRHSIQSGGYQGASEKSV